MRRGLSAVALAIFALAAQPTVRIAAQRTIAGPPAARGQAGIDAAFAQFWAARTPAEGVSAAPAIVKSGVSFDEALARLKRGRAYPSRVTRGVVRLSHRAGQTEFPYTVQVPQNYDPSRPYQLRVQLHGGVGRQ